MTMGKGVPIAIIVLIALGIVFLGYHLLSGRVGFNGSPKENVPAENGEPKEIEFKTFANGNYYFQIEYPDNWNLMELKQWDAQGFNAPFVSENIVDAFIISENAIENNWWRIGLIVYSTKVVENEYGENSLDNLVSFLSLWGITIFIKYDKDNYPAVNYAGVTSTTQFRGTLALKDDYLYQLTIETPEEDYSISEPIFQHVIHSFNILA
jgi:hypothetical protein